MAGANPTQAAVIKDLRGLKSYNANGLLPETIDYSTIFGHDLAKTCAWVMQAREDRLHGRLVAAVLRDGHPGDVDGDLVVGSTVTDGVAWRVQPAAGRSWSTVTRASSKLRKRPSGVDSGSGSS